MLQNIENYVGYKTPASKKPTKKPKNNSKFSNLAIFGHFGKAIAGSSQLA